MYNPQAMPTKKSIYDRTLRRWFPKRYIRMVMARHTLQYREKMEAATSREDRQELEDDHHWRMRELDDWLTSIEDTELVTKQTEWFVSDNSPVADPN